MAEKEALAIGMRRDFRVGVVLSTSTAKGDLNGGWSTSSQTLDRIPVVFGPLRLSLVTSGVGRRPPVYFRSIKA